MRGATVTFYFLLLGLAATASPLNQLEWFQATKHPNPGTLEPDLPNGHNGYFSLLCWVEKTVTTQSKHTGEGGQHKEFSIIMESPGKITTEEDICESINKNELRNVKNSTSIKEHGDKIITDSRVVFCGFGPVLSEQYLELPQVDKKIMEVKISNGLPVTWGMCQRRNHSDYSETVGSVQSSSTFDTTCSPETTKQVTEIEDQAWSSRIPRLGMKRDMAYGKTTSSYAMTESNGETFPGFKLPGGNQDHRISKTTKGSYSVSESNGENFPGFKLPGGIQDHRISKTTKRSYSVTESNEENFPGFNLSQGNQDNYDFSQNCSDDTENKTKDHQSKAYNLLLSRNVNFVSLNDFKAMKNPFENTNLLMNMRKEKGPVLFNLLFPRESIFENHNGHNEKRVFVVKIKITLSCQEMLNDDTISHKAEGSKMEIEEDNLFIILPSSKEQ